MNTATYRRPKYTNANPANIITNPNRRRDPGAISIILAIHPFI